MAYIQGATSIFSHYCDLETSKIYQVNEIETAKLKNKKILNLFIFHEVGTAASVENGAFLFLI